MLCTNCEEKIKLCRFNISEIQYYRSYGIRNHSLLRSKTLSYKSTFQTSGMQETIIEETDSWSKYLMLHVKCFISVSCLHAAQEQCFCLGRCNGYVTQEIIYFFYRINLFSGWKHLNTIRIHLENITAQELDAYVHIFLARPQATFVVWSTHVSGMLLVPNWVVYVLRSVFTRVTISAMTGWEHEAEFAFACIKDLLLCSSWASVDVWALSIVIVEAGMSWSTASEADAPAIRSGFLLAKTSVTSPRKTIHFPFPFKINSGSKCPNDEKKDSENRGTVE